MAYKKWLCVICGFIYDEAEGWPDDGIPPGTAWDAVPDDWVCPECLVGKADFEMIEITDDQPEPTADAIPFVALATSQEPVVIVGSGHAGYQLASALRALSPSLPITLFTADDGAIYSKPMLSCALASGKTAERLRQSSALEWEQQLNIRLYPHTRVLSIDRQQRRLETSIGPCHYGRLVLATGAEPIRPAINGDASALISVNQLADYGRFQEAIDGKRHITILGDGLIGCEFAHDLAGAGYAVTVVGLGHWPMATLLPQSVGRGLQTALSRMGVTWRLNTTLVAAARSQGEYAWQLTLSNGELLDSDLVLSAIGLKPNIGLAQQCGLSVNKGICVNQYGQTSDDAILAIGDCAEFPGGWRPYIAPINQAVPALAQSLNGVMTPVDQTPGPVIVKTPNAPLSFHPPSGPGQWHTETRGADLMAWHYDDSNIVTGFALLGAGIQNQRSGWMTEIVNASAALRFKEL
ncbi:FAD-dependent oxidoreductase [Enterobacteriaceae bacterium BIT-l23]|uniref:FAD-dependent oxidoreductase n=1 Tax=Jejubacter sp. L23 TaxID=3092086 RepID=UPI001584D980|nr:FAD-dependent oxidoreductase [Enterobacteriaceae bacterium BIT-l23]